MAIPGVQGQCQTGRFSYWNIFAKQKEQQQTNSSEFQLYIKVHQSKPIKREGKVGGDKRRITRRTGNDEQNKFSKADLVVPNGGSGKGNRDRNEPPAKRERSEQEKC